MNILSTPLSEHADYEWSVILIRYILDAVGLWPRQLSTEQKVLDKIQATVVLISVITIILIPLICALVLLLRDDLLAFLESFGFVMAIVTSLVKYVTFYANKEDLLLILKMMEDDWKKPKMNAEREVMIQHARIARAFVSLSYALVSWAAIALIFLPKLGMPLRHSTKETEMFLLPTYYIIDISRSPYVEIIYVLQLITALMVACCYVGVDSFFGLLVLHISAQLENLQTRLANIKTSTHFDRVLKDTVMDHTRLIRAVDVIENTYMLLLLILLTNFGIFSCLSIFEIVTVINGKDNYSKSILYLQLPSYINTFLQTCLYCIAGQLLVTQSEGVYEAAYDCEWLNLKPKDAKNLILIMARSKKPLYVTAGKLFPMTMLTFCNLLKISLSYMSFLLTKV